MHKKHSLFLWLIRLSLSVMRSLLGNRSDFQIVITLAIIGMIFYIIHTILIAGPMTHPFKQTTTTLIPVDSLAATGGSMLVIRLPPHPSYPQEQIDVHKPSSDMLALRQIADMEERQQHTSSYVAIHLNSAQWQQVNIIRHTWCQTTPVFHNPPNEVFYDVGLYCLSSNSHIGFTKRVQIPVDELPSELTQLIETVPSPTCDDSFCGWRE